MDVLSLNSFHLQLDLEDAKLAALQRNGEEEMDISNEAVHNLTDMPMVRVKLPVSYSRTCSTHESICELTSSNKSCNSCMIGQAVPRQGIRIISIRAPSRKPTT